jgi:glutathione synthase/RimK-type ligase-like ATP-grasp enzyme
MKLQYDAKKRIFYHSEGTESVISFGKDSFLLNKQDQLSHYSFVIKNCNSIPLIGILASRKEKNKYKGNFSLFRSIQEDLQNNGAAAFVFCPDDILDDGIAGIIYHEQTKKWVKCHFPIPNVIYNRVPARQDELSQEYKKLLQFIKHHNIIFFNPHFFNKWEVYSVLSANPSLKNLLPKTELINETDRFIDFLKANKVIYVKPVSSSQGKGIKVIELCSDGTITGKSIKKIEKFSSIGRFIQAYSLWFIQNDRIMQEAIQCETYNGHRFDYRILVQHNGQEFIVTGIGVRVSGRQDVTTHVPAGGKIIPLKEVASRSIKNQLKEIANWCGSELAKAYGYIGEFSIDLAPKRTGGLILFEVNSKPMSFDEEDIERKRRKELINTFLVLSKRN